MADPGLTIEIQNNRAVELVDFTNSLSAFAEEFRKTIDLGDPDAAAADVRLYVKEMRAGSIIAELVALAPQALQLISYANSVVSFYNHVKTAKEYLAGETSSKPALDKTTYQNMMRIVEPIAKDHGSQIIIGVHNGPLHLTINSLEANAIQNQARREIDLMAEPTMGLHEKVLLYWYQARGDAKSKTGDRAIIESISSTPVKTICANDTIKAQMILDEENPFKEAYVVDVIVETINGKPALYKILAMHEKFERSRYGGE